MSRKTPIKELIAEEAGTPNSSIRRSSRIATRRSSAQEETLSQKLKQHDDESDRISISSASSIGSRSGKKTRTSSKSPVPPSIEEIGKIPAKRGRKGSTSSLVDEELVSINRGGSPTPSRITRRSLARSISVSPISELENRKRSTSQRSVSESSSKPGLPRRNLMSSTEASVLLESIEEQSPHKEKVNSIENTDEKDLPLKKKKSALLQTIDENHRTDVETNKTESNVSCNEEDKVTETSVENTEVESKEVHLNSEKDKKNVSFEERELRVVLNNIQEINVNIDESKNICVPQNENGDTSKQAIELNFEEEDLNLHVSVSDEDCKNHSKSVTVTTDRQSPQKVVNGIQDDTLSEEAAHVDTSTIETAEVQIEESICEHMEVDVDTLPSKYNENDNDPNVSNNSEQPNLEVQTSVCVESLDSSTDPTNATLNLSSKPEILSRSPNELQFSPEKDKIVDNNDSLPTINLADPESSDSVKAQSTPVRKEPTLPSKVLSSSNSLEDETTVTLSPSPSKNKIHNISTGTSNAVDDHKLIVAASLTPLRRSPRLNASDKKLDASSSENLAQDVLKINTPPDSIKSGNSSGDTDHEISGNELKNDFVSDATSKNENDSKELNDKIVSDNENENDGNVEENLKDSEVSVSNLVNKTKNEVSFSSIPELNSTLVKKITELTNNLEVESSSDESAHDFIEDMAEEVEEDTPSEGSNDIIDLGESVGSTESEIDSDESYELDSFIDDDENEDLLSGEEYDLDQTKSKRKSTKKRSRIVKLDDSSDEDKNNELENKVQRSKKDVEISPKKKEFNHKMEDDSDVENMSTKAYCGLTPPSVVSIRDSPSDEENKDYNNKEDGESITSVLINKEDNLESLEQIKDSIPENLNKSLKKSPLKVSPSKIAAQEKRKSRTPNNSVLESSTSMPNSTQRKRLSSLNIQETVNAKDISDGSISDRIMKVVEAFCSTVKKTGDNSEGNISLNVSFDYISTSPDKPKIHKEHTEIIVIEPSHQKTQSDAPAKSEFRTASNESNSVKVKSSPVKILFDKCSSSDEQVSDGEEDNNEVLIKPKKFGQSNVEKSKATGKASEDELSKKNKRKKRKSTEIISTTAERQTTEERAPISKRQRKMSKTAKEVEEINSESDSDMSPDLDKELSEKYQDSEMDDEGSSSEAYNTKFGLSNEHKKLKKGKQIVSLSDISNASYKKASKKSKKTRDANEFVGDENVSPSTSKKVLSDSNESRGKHQSPRKKRAKVPNVSNEGGWQIEYLPEEIKVALSLGRSNYQTQQSKSKEIKSAPKKKPKVIPTANGGEKSWSSDKMNVSLKPTTSYTSKNSNVESFHSKDFKNRTLFDTKRVKRVDTREFLKKKEKYNY